jgi:hypothetical protein
VIYRQTDAIEVLGKDIPPQGRDYALRGGAGQEYFISNRYFPEGRSANLLRPFASGHSAI